MEALPVHLALTDNNSGVAALQVLFRSPSGAQLHTSCYPFDPSVPRPPDSGNDTKGDWICPTIWPQFSEPGTWTVYYVNLADKVRNSVTYFRYGGGDLCDSRTRTDCLDTPPEVVVASTPADVTRPTATSLTVSLATVPRSFGSSIMVDPSAGGVSVVFGLDATDDIAGIGGDPNFDRDPYFYGVNLTGPSGQGYGWYCSSTPVTGTTRDGFFECYSYIPPAAEEGTWRITYLSLTDRVGNTSAYDDDGTGRICNTDGDCLTPPTVQVGGMGDAEAPMIQTYSLSVTGDEVTIDVGVTDVGIGADFVRVNYYSQTSAQYQYCDATLTSGTNMDGTWSCTITFSEFAARGEWRPRVDLRDQAFNFRNYTRGSDDGILCYTEGGAETCQDFGDTDVILR